MTMSQIAVMIENVVADAPALVHAEIDAKPKPVPSAASRSEIAAATAAPAITAAHETAETGDSFPATGWSGAASADCTAMIEPSVPDQREQKNDWNRYTQQPEQNPASHDWTSSLKDLLKK